MKRKKEDLVVEQNEFWRKETTLTHDKQQFSTDLRNKESQLHGMIGRSTLNGINAIKGRGYTNFSYLLLTSRVKCWFYLILDWKTLP